MKNIKKNTLVTLFLANLKGGGIQRATVDLAYGFVKQGLKVDIILSKATGPFIKQVPRGVQIINLKNLRLRQHIFALIRYLRRKQPKALLSNCHYNNEIAILAKHLSRVSTLLVVVEHNTYSKISRSSIKMPLDFFGLTPRRPISLIKYFYPWADKIIAVSKGVAKELANITSLSLKNIEVIYNPVITPDIFKKVKELVDHPWFAPGSSPVILGVGRLVGQKDFPTLIKAFAKVRKQQKARLVILGEGPDKSKLSVLIHKLNIEKDVDMPGYSKNPYAFMARAKVFVLSSIYEGFGNVLAEAMACGTPVISTDCPSGPSEILKNGKYGKLVAVGDSNALAEAILKVLNGEKKKVPKSWLEQFTVDHVVKEYLKILYKPKII
jgi:glycosyltransferase involved in cell wall biosynthesis